MKKQCSHCQFDYNEGEATGKKCAFPACRGRIVAVAGDREGVAVGTVKKYLLFWRRGVLCHCRWWMPEPCGSCVGARTSSLAVRDLASCGHCGCSLRRGDTAGITGLCWCDCHAINRLKALWRRIERKIERTLSV